jgi:hypothetical protein
MILSWVVWTYLANKAITMASKVLKMSKQGTAGNRKHTTFMSPLKLETIRKPESGKS